MELKEMSIEQLEERKVAISAELDAPEADLDALEKEARAINAELEERKAVEAKKAETRKMVAEGNGEEIRTFKVEEKKEMTLQEIRSSKEYIDAFANYIKTGDDAECRALLSTNATNGQVPVPEIIEGKIRTAWERAGIMNLVQKTYVRGNLKIGFELSATGAEVHAEGDMENLPAEEILTFGVVQMVPESIKKWITISDEALDLGGQEFLDYIYDEITYQIAKKAEAILIALINDAPAAATANSVSVGTVTGALGVDTVVKALGQLSAEAANPVIVTTRQNWAALKSAAMDANYAVDPFEGLPVYFASADVLGTSAMIVGDFGHGAHANFPNGNEITIKFDDLSLAEKDLVKIVGREFVALGLVADKSFVKVVAA